MAEFNDLDRIEHPYYKLKYLFGMLGVNSLIIQVILFRELFVTFSGNELSWGIFFATWLFSGALGSYSYAAVRLAVRNKKKAIYLILIFEALLLAGEIVIIRIIKTKLGYEPSESLTIEEISIITASLVLVPSFIFGALYAMIIDFTKEVLKDDRIRIAGMVYSFEALGFFFAGIIFSFVLVSLFGSMAIMLLLLILNFVYGYLLMHEDFLLSEKPFYMIPTSLSIKVLTLTFISVTALFLIVKLDLIQRVTDYTHKVQWQGLDFIEQVDSKHGKITVTEKAGQYNFFNNSHLAFTMPDVQGAEESIHLIMSHHKDPKTVLLLDGLADDLKQLYKYDLDKITNVVLDPLLIDTMNKYLSHDDSLYFREKNVQTIFTDARNLIRNSDEKYDVIILNAGEPSTLFANRYFTREFYALVRERLNDDGVFSFSVSSSPNYLSGAMYFMQASMYQTLAAEFKNVKLISAGMLTFIVSNSDSMMKEEPIDLFDRFAGRRLNNEYFSEYAFLELVADERNSDREALLKSEARDIVNYDFNPKTYILSILLLGEESGSVLTEIMNAIFLKENKLVFLYVFIAFFALSLAHYAFWYKRQRSLDLYVVVFTSGFASIAMEILLLIIFQILFGYVYYKIGTLIAIFMLGLFAGSYLSNRYFIVSSPERQRQYIFALEVLIIAYLAASCSVLAKVYLPIFAKHSSIIYIMLFLSSLVAGMQFPVTYSLLVKCGMETSEDDLRKASDDDPRKASENTLHKAPEDDSLYHRVGGRLYAADLFGACLGSVIVTLLLLPFFGVYKAFLVVIMIKFCSLLFLCTGSLLRRYR